MDVLAEYDGSGNLEAEHIYGLDGMVSKLDPTEGNLWFVKDHLGSTRRLNSSSMKRDYYPFGKDYTSAGSETDYTFTGKEKDNSELYYFGARYYDARIGRWLSVDPLAEKYVTQSPYNHTYNNPLVYLDLDGRAVIFVNGFPANFKTKEAYWDGFWQKVMARVPEGEASYFYDGSRANIPLLKTALRMM